MRRAVMYLAIVGLVGLVGAAPAAAEESQGEKVFAAQKCAMCHSIGGKGNQKGPLDAAITKLSAEEIREWITDAKGMTAKTNATRKPAMKQFSLPKGDVDVLVVYLSSMKKK